MWKSRVSHNSGVPTANTGKEKHLAFARSLPVCPLDAPDNRGLTIATPGRPVWLCLRVFSNLTSRVLAFEAAKTRPVVNGTTAFPPTPLCG